MLIGLCVCFHHISQVPQYAAMINLTSPGLISALHSQGINVHFWVINDPATMKRLIAAGE